LLKEQSKRIISNINLRQILQAGKIFKLDTINPKINKIYKARLKYKVENKQITIHNKSLRNKTKMNMLLNLLNKNKIIVNK
jgi:hypothetical protein